MNDSKEQRNHGEKTIDINEYFDNVYLLNLDREPLRYEKTKNKLDYLNIEFERFTAIDGEEIPGDEYDYSAFRLGRGMIENKYALACLRSHMAIINDAKSNDYKRILVFEDDVLICEEINKHIQKLINIADWKLLYLGSSQYKWNVKFIEGFYYPKETLGCFAYAIDSSVYDEILDSNKEKLSLDNLITTIQKRHYKDCYVFYPNVCIASVGESSIREGRDQESHGIIMRWNILGNYI